ncbi:MAG TPA: hypothetical protein VHJ78_03425, partial [Actinomycetota bacterium]|nr:hypothetical protein [Actinomycetota bacterium]
RQSMQRGSRAPHWRRPAETMLSGFEPRWEVSAPAVRLRYRTYDVAGRQARCYDLGRGELARAEVHDDAVFLGWSTALQAFEWVDHLHDLVVVKGNVLGLVVLSAGEPDIRGDLTWREVRALVEDPATVPLLVRIDVGRMSLVWREPEVFGGTTREAGVSASSFDAGRLRQLLESTATPKVRAWADDLLRDARQARTWAEEESPGRR